MIEIVIGVLLVIVIAEAYWINLLINKLMSRNFYDYKITQSATQNKKKSDKMVEKPNTDDVEDLNYLGAVR